MAELPTFEAMVERGAGRPAPAPVVTLYREAYARFGTSTLWSRQPTNAQALVAVQGLRRKGDMAARAFV